MLYLFVLPHFLIRKVRPTFRKVLQCRANRLLIEYDGRPYNGFQAQGDLPSVQTSLEAAILKFSGETLRLTTAGRTDTGVHATGAVVSFDLDKTFKPAVVRDAMNASCCRNRFPSWRRRFATIPIFRHAFPPLGGCTSTASSIAVRRLRSIRAASGTSRNRSMPR